MTWRKYLDPNTCCTSYWVDTETGERRSEPPSQWPCGLTDDDVVRMVANRPVNAAERAAILTAMREEWAAPGSRRAEWERILNPPIAKGFSMPVTEFAALFPPLETVAECFRCGHTVFQEHEIGAKCSETGCEGRYIRA